MLHQQFLSQTLFTRYKFAVRFAPRFAEMRQRLQDKSHLQMCKLKFTAIIIVAVAISHVARARACACAGLRADAAQERKFATSPSGWRA